jgi:hypothetical protein
MKTILVFGANAAMDAVIRRTLAPRGFSSRPVSDLLEVISASVLRPGTGLIIIAACDPGGCAESVRLLLETRLEASILVVFNANTCRRTRSLLPRAAATIRWPFFPSDLVAAITLLQEEAREQFRQQLDKAQKRLIHLSVELKLADEI